jgi:hypothetical protein
MPITESLNPIGRRRKGRRASTTKKELLSWFRKHSAFNYGTQQQPDITEVSNKQPGSSILVSLCFFVCSITVRYLHNANEMDTCPDNLHFIRTGPIGSSIQCYHIERP